MCGTHQCGIRLSSCVSQVKVALLWWRHVHGVVDTLVDERPLQERQKGVHVSPRAHRAEAGSDDPGGPRVSNQVPNVCLGTGTEGCSYSPGRELLYQADAVGAAVVVRRKGSLELPRLVLEGSEYAAWAAYTWS